MEFESFVLAAVTADLEQEPAARATADAIEFRMDLAAAPLDQLRAYDGALPVIATNRVETEGGDAPDEPSRIEDLVTAASISAVEAVDIEAAALHAEAADDLPDPGSDVGRIVSAHDFAATPGTEEMAATLRAAARAGDVGKLAVTATDPADVLALLEVTQELTASGLTVATMAMGEAGQHSRAVAPLYGSRIGYAPVSADAATAPGQFDLATLRTLVETLGVP
ncbi:MAG: type I 3-dehydroquinate dehydratase [Halobacteriales archaeon]